MVLEETWVTFDAIPRYSVSDYGRVINNETGRELKAQMDPNGFLHVTLYRNGIPHKGLLHRLVAKAFLLNYEPGVQIDFINGIKHDCAAINLQIAERGCRRSGDDIPLW